MPKDAGELFLGLYQEYEKHESIESRTTKDLDLFDMVLQAFQYEKSELARKGSIPDLSAFFHGERVVNRIVNSQVKEWLAALMVRRTEFLACNALKIEKDQVE